MYVSHAKSGHLQLKIIAQILKLLNKFHDTLKYLSNESFAKNCWTSSVLGAELLELS